MYGWNFPALDMGFYTAQPATVEQVQYCFRHLRQLRDELARFMGEVGKYPDNLEEVQEQAAELDKQLDALADDLTGLQETTEDQGGQLQGLAERLDTLGKTLAKFVTGAVTGFKLGGNNNRLVFETVQDGKPVKTGTEFSGDLNTIVSADGSEIVQQLDADKHTEQWTATNNSDSVVMRFKNRPVFELQTAAQPDGVQDLAATTDGDRISITLDSTELVSRVTGLEADAASALNVRGVVLRSETLTDNEGAALVLDVQTGDGRQAHRVNLTPGDGIILDGTPDGIKIGALDQLRKFAPFDIDRVHVEPYRISLETRRFDKTPNGGWGLGEAFAPQTIEIEPTSETGLINIGWDAGNVKLDDRELFNQLQAMQNDLLGLIEKQAETIRTLEARLTTVENAKEQTVTGCRIQASPAAADILKLELKADKADGSSDNSATFVKFANSDHGLQYTVQDVGEPDTCNVGINFDKKWLTRQGLKPDIEIV